MLQEAIKDARAAGLRGVGPGAALLTASGAARKLDARHVSKLWLDRYLEGAEKHATACLSLFAATFDTSGAAAVLHGPEADAQQQDTSEQMLRLLRSVSVLQEAPVGPMSAQPESRYSMHPLIRGLAVELRSGQSEADCNIAARNFVVYMLQKGGNELASLSRTAAAAPFAAQLLDWEAPNIAAMLELVAADRHQAGAMLKEDSQRGETCRDALHDLAVAMSNWNQPQLAEQAGRAVYNARRHRAEDPDTLPSMSNLATSWLSWDRSRRPQTCHGRRWKGDSACWGLSTLTH